MLFPDAVVEMLLEFHEIQNEPMVENVTGDIGACVRIAARQLPEESVGPAVCIQSQFYRFDEFAHGSLLDKGQYIHHHY